MIKTTLIYCRIFHCFVILYCSFRGVNSGGQNVYVSQVAKHLANLGYAVDVFTRRDRPDLPEVVGWHNGVQVIPINAGTLTALAKKALFPPPASCLLL